MKSLRSSFIFSFLVLPLVGFCDYSSDLQSFLSDNSCILKFNLFCVDTDSNSFIDSGVTYSGSPSGVLGFIQSQYIGLAFYKDSSDLYRPNVNQPSFGSFSYSRPFISSSYTNQYFGFYYFPSVRNYFGFVGSIYSFGYRGDSLRIVRSTSSYDYVDFNFSVFVNEVLYGTNTVYKSLLLSYLGSISSTVNNINDNVSSISSALIPSLSRIEEINSGISSGVSSISESVSSIYSYSSEMNETLHGTHNTLTNIEGVVSSIPSYLLSNSNSLDRLHDDNVLSSIDVYLGDDTSAWVGFCNWACDNYLITSSDRDSFISELNDTDSSNPTPSPSYSIPLAHRRFLVKHQIKGRVVAANNMRGQLQMLYPSSDLNSSGTSWGVQAISDIGHQFTTGVRHELMNNNATVLDWRDNLRQQLQDWKTSDETGILNVRKDIKDNFTISDPRSPSNTIPFTAFVTNFVVVPVTNSIEKSADQITTNLTDQADQTRQLLNDKLFNPDSDGVNVRIKWPLRYYSVDEVNVHDAALDDLMHNFYDWSNMVSNMFEGAILSFSEHMPSNSVDWSEWFERWDDFRIAWDSACSNLWLYYSQYNSTFKDFSQDNFKDFDFVSSNTIERVASLGGFSGSYWDFQVATTLLQTDFFQLMFDFYNEVSDVLSQYHDPKTGQPFTLRSALRSIASGLPSPTAIVSDVGSFTNSYNLTYVVSMSNFLASADSRFTSIIESTYRDHSLPGTIRLFTFNEQSFEIPTGPLSSAFGYLRTGLAFGYSVLLIILLPKYVLFWLRMYSKTFLLALSTSRFRRH